MDGLDGLALLAEAGPGRAKEVTGRRACLTLLDLPGLFLLLGGL